MTRSRRWFGLILAVTLVPAGAWTLLARQGEQKPAPPPPIRRTNDVGAFMRLKLNHAQKVLEGIALEDFPAIAKNAQAMSLLVEDENWAVYQTPEYRHFSSDFRRISDQLMKEGREKRLDAAALAYVQLTMSCVNCHKYVRDARMARGQLPGISPLADPAVGIGR
jgi:hypothetical protein